MRDDVEGPAIERQLLVDYMHATSQWMAAHTALMERCGMRLRDIAADYEELLLRYNELSDAHAALQGIAHTWPHSS